jgi:hypothetical protein
MLKGISLLSTLKNKYKYNTYFGISYAGSSAGAITAALLAIGYSISELEVLLLGLDMSEFVDARGGIVSKAARLYLKGARGGERRGRGKGEERQGWSQVFEIYFLFFFF